MPGDIVQVHWYPGMDKDGPFSELDKPVTELNIKEGVIVVIGEANPENIKKVLEIARKNGYAGVWFYHDYKEFDFLTNSKKIGDYNEWFQHEREKEIIAAKESNLTR